ncbi:MAG: hypothetical protein ACJAVO_000671 [Parvibaculaceae bacterium]|jgi:hypothetical protein|tara:strand:- start:385 stop:594 length:210 start_codon:yes stop_codon:yes gene_type:complete
MLFDIVETRKRNVDGGVLAVLKVFGLSGLGTLLNEPDTDYLTFLKYPVFYLGSDFGWRLDRDNLSVLIA